MFTERDEYNPFQEFPKYTTKVLVINHVIGTGGANGVVQFNTPLRGLCGFRVREINITPSSSLDNRISTMLFLHSSRLSGYARAPRFISVDNDASTNVMEQTDVIGMVQIMNTPSGTNSIGNADTRMKTREVNRWYAVDNAKVLDYMDWGVSSFSSALGIESDSHVEIVIEFALKDLQ